MIKLSDYLVRFFVEHGVKETFLVTGGGAMHLNDALAHNPDMHSTFNHHEQACAIAAEGYARLTGNIALCCVTSGPGGTNAITGVIGGYLDSVPMFVVSGQVKRETTIYATDLPLRQLGDQEFDIIHSVQNCTKYAAIVLEPNDIAYHLEKAFYLATHGRKGPVWLDIPLDVQAAKIDEGSLRHFDPSELEGGLPQYDGGKNREIIERIAKAKRPVVLVGEGVRFSGMAKRLIELLDLLRIPVVTAWNAHDLVWDEYPFYAGRPGTVGTRGGNFVVQNSDLLLVLGCRLNIRQISYNYKSFAKNAFKIMVDIDKAELEKPTLSIDMPIHADLAEFIPSLINDLESIGMPAHEDWVRWARNVNQRYPACLPAFLEKNKPLNPYAFVKKLFEALSEGDVVVTGNGAACVQGFQAAEIKQNQRLFTNSGCAAMGYGFPASIGACVGNEGRRVICLDGDGSFQMNIQELQTVIYNRFNLKIIYLNNSGYLSIKQTQTNLFKPPLFGCLEGTGLSFPDMSKVAPAYGFDYVCVESLDDCGDKLKRALNGDGPIFIEAKVDPAQNFEPKLSSKVLPDGKIVSPDIDDMFPFLSREEYGSNKIG